MPEEVYNYVKANVRDRKPSVNLVRGILKSAGYQKHYPAAVCILASVTQTEIVKSTPEERVLVEKMHRQYDEAFLKCPSEVRRRKSSLTNNYIAAKFYQMLGKEYRIKFIRMLTGPKKIREHDRVFRWIVNYVRTQTSEREAVEAGISYWQWFETPEV